MIDLDAPVQALIRDVATRIVMPRFRQLDDADIEEKAPDEIVTIADKESEAALIEGLTRLLPGSRVIGEEGVAVDESLLDGIGSGVAWIVDPIDGTANFAAGNSPFGIMVALMRDGVSEAAWIFDPVIDRMCCAARGRGAFVNRERVTARSSGAAIPIAGLSIRYLPKDMCADVQRRAEGKLHCVAIPRCAAEQYPRVMLGTNDIALFWRTHVWDHAAGAMILTEAGGKAARLDGTPYRVDQTGTGLLIAASPRTWDDAAQLLFG